MKAEIKERIEMISRGEVPEGYKKTKVGIIPEDWEVRKLWEITGKDGIVRGPFGSALKKSYFIEKGYKVYQQGNAINKDINYGEYYINKDKFEELKRFQINQGDFIISCSGTIGQIYQIPEQFEKGVINQALLKLVLDNDIIDDAYFINVFESDRFQNRIIESTQGGAMKNLVGMKIFRNIEFSTPLLREQEKIGNILSTWDKAIELKEQLIEEKKEQKKGLMQRLLTGEVRLPGYDEEWEKVRLGDIGEFSTSSVNKKIENKQELVRLVNYMDVYNNYIIDDSIDYMIVSATESQIDKFSLQKGDVLFTPSSETADDIGHSAVVKTDQGKLLYSYHLVRLRFKKLMDLDFKGYVFNNTDILGKFTKLASGATRYTLNLDDFRETSIKIPKSLEEQKAIAQVLSTANKEIELLEEELEQLKLQKKGLMQLLLTGIIRVKS